MKQGIMALVFVALILSSSAALAVGPEPLELVGDCDGWTIDGFMFFGGSTQVDWTYWVSLAQGPDTLYQFSESGTLYSEGTFHFEGTWDMELCGDYTAVVVLMWVGGPCSSL